MVRGSVSKPTTRLTGMLCLCGAKLRVIDSDTVDDGRTVIRSRRCPLPPCRRVYHTEEKRVLAALGAKVRLRK